jgi:hypothetical protein
MNFDPNVLSWKDWILVGVCIGLYLANRGRRHQGERIGRVEHVIDRMLGLHSSDDESGNHGKGSKHGDKKSD